MDLHRDEVVCTLTCIYGKLQLKRKLRENLILCLLNTKRGCGSEGGRTSPRSASLDSQCNSHLSTLQEQNHSARASLSSSLPFSSLSIARIEWYHYLSSILLWMVSRKWRSVLYSFQSSPVFANSKHRSMETPQVVTCQTYECGDL